MDDREIRLECLRIAAKPTMYCGEDLVQSANMLYQFVIGGGPEDKGQGGTGSFAAHVHADGKQDHHPASAVSHKAGLEIEYPAHPTDGVSKFCCDFEEQEA